MGLSTFVICTSFLLFIPQIIMGTISPDTTNFFNDKIKGNLTKITWAHAVNNKQLLNQTLTNASIMMVEADVVLGRLNNSLTNESMPIMAHPPVNVSDLTLEEFLTTMIKDGKKGVKLDFKSIEAFNSSISILRQHRENLTFPVWLNADILPGPVNATTLPVNAQQFIDMARENFSESTLSLGWTTNYGQKANISDGTYTKAHIEEMINVISNISQTITYPVRAGMVINSYDLWSDLLNKTSNRQSTLTIWSSDGDNVDAKKLSAFVKKIGVNRVYVDVPHDLMEKLDFSAASGTTPGLLMMACAIFANILLAKFF